MSDQITLVLATEDVAAIRSALNEVLELVDEWEFEIRLGRTKGEFEALLTRLRRLGKEEL